MSKPRILDLFCGAGGAAMGLYRAGFEVVGVDIKPQPHYPFTYVRMDAMLAMDLLLQKQEVWDIHDEWWTLKSFDAIWASPPCQHYSMMMNITKSKEKHPDLIEPTRQRLIATGKPYIIENVYKAPLQGHIMLCGTSFGLRIIRHRYFESPWIPLTLIRPCDHSDVYDPWHQDAAGQLPKLSKAMGIDWQMTRPEVREAIPPAYSEYLGKYLLKAIATYEREGRMIRVLRGGK